MSETEREHLWRVVEEKAQKGDGAALNILGSLYVDKALERLDAAFLDLAEEYFRRAAENGNRAAQDFLESGCWHQAKEEYVMRIRTSRQEEGESGTDSE